MTLDEILDRGAVIADLRVNSKKQLFHELAEVACASLGVDARVILDAINERERLGSTGFGNGVAVPHARLSDIDAVAGVFARLETPIDFEAIDERPADLVFLLLAPEDAGAEHLKALAKVARFMRREEFRARLRAAPEADALRALFTETETTEA